MYALRVKTQLLKDGRFLMGDGRAALLRHIEDERSLLKASKRMGMSYRHAWGSIKRMEKALGEKVVRSTRGGRKGGETLLTKAGRRALDEFERRTREAAERARGQVRLAVDGIIVRGGKLVAVRRAYEPFEGEFALPGGFVEVGETTGEAVVREVLEETGLRTKVKGLVGVYSSPDRDPRGHVVSAVYELEVLGGRLRKSHEAKEIGLLSMEKAPKLAFDHTRIVQDFLSNPSWC